MSKVKTLFMVLLFYLFLFPLSVFAIGYGIEDVGGDTVWMGWTYYESGNKGYASAGGDGGRAYGRYQFDYEYALPDFIAYVLEENPETYTAILGKYASYPAGSSSLLAGAGLKTDWVRAYNADPDGFSALQDEFAYEYYYIPAKQAMSAHGIDLDEIDDPVVKGTVYSFSIRDGASENGVRAGWQSYSAGITVTEWISKMYDLEASRHPSQSSRWNGEQRVAALNGGTTTGVLGNLGTVLASNGAVYTDFVREWIEKYPELSKGFVASGGWNTDNKDWAQALRSAGDFYELYGVKGGNLDFASGTSGGVYISDIDVALKAEASTIPDNGSTMPIVYLPQSGGQPWSGVAFGGGTIATSGCSVSSLAMVISYLKGGVDSTGWVYPDDVVSSIAKKYGNYNKFYVGSGQSWDIFPAVSSIYGINCSQISSASIIQALSSGKPVIMSCKPGEFTSTGHFIVLTGVTEDGYITVNDPNSAHASYSYKKYPLSFIQSQGKGWWCFS